MKDENLTLDSYDMCLFCVLIKIFLQALIRQLYSGILQLGNNIAIQFYLYSIKIMF